MSRLTIGTQLRSERELKSFKQSDIANNLHCDRAAISRIENGKYQGSLQLLERYLNLMGLEITATPIKQLRPTLDSMDGVYDND